MSGYSPSSEIRYSPFESPISRHHEIGYPIFAQPDKYGAMDLDQLHDYFVSWVDPLISSKKPTPVVLDFSLVKFWDISCLLWLIVALHYYKRKGLRFLLCLPKSDQNMLPDEKMQFQKSADFLRRWRFDKGLRNLSSNLSTLLVPSQVHYFDIPARSYSPAEVKTDENIREILISKRLAEIKNLADLAAVGPREVSDRKIWECIRDFQAARIGDILNYQCGIEKRKADLFSDHLLTEALVNVKEHPHATIGMMAISVLGASGELVLAVADNGDAIPKTIYKTFLESPHTPEERKEGFPKDYLVEKLTIKQKGMLSDFATLPGVSRKRSFRRAVPGFGEDSIDPQYGMGLHYIRQDTVETFGGSFRMVTAGVTTKYVGSYSNRTISNARYMWPGNLLRISIPILPRR